jgi:mediator of RNA polymerase II transcription subunit 21
MSNTIAYLTSRANFLQVSPEIPVTKQRNPEKYDPPDVFEGIQDELSKKGHDE